MLMPSCEVFNIPIVSSVDQYSCLHSTICFCIPWFITIVSSASCVLTKPSSKVPSLFGRQICSHPRAIKFIYATTTILIFLFVFIRALFYCVINSICYIYVGKNGGVYQNCGVMAWHVYVTSGLAARHTEQWTRFSVAARNAIALPACEMVWGGGVQIIRKRDGKELQTESNKSKYFEGNSDHITKRSSR
jgi:hypothetical protein